MTPGSSAPEFGLMQGELTDRQATCLAFIVEFLSGRGYPPTMREIGKHMGIRSTNGIADHLKALERKGFIVRGDMMSRGIRVLHGPAGSKSADVLMAENARLRLLLRDLYVAATERSGWKLDGVRAAISKEFASNGVTL